MWLQLLLLVPIRRCIQHPECSLSGCQGGLTRLLCRRDRRRSGPCRGSEPCNYFNFGTAPWSCSRFKLAVTL
ncbi:uncharacterized protein B0I36DRAFT_321183 [Microdochium trichocladiopsis]|uniref:Secreted protein n=1 Tax=Microdochium trichocladiopsis TaxID=1682393 RepID=A0A9P9BPN2_9PEZI|nr:uncharacterized protein B0I36DRAFT_321183 [Microdochium trichocladiopsis]KAH7033309.1 hypothetical protein B0I36DRAFT_321183 [Microdochium trichocladiopsis]